MKKLLYDDLKLRAVIGIVEDRAKKVGDEFNREFLDFHNHICPCCQKEMKIERHSNTVKNVGAVATGIYSKMKLTVPYVICKPCSKNEHMLKANIQNTENYILGKLCLLDAIVPNK